MTVQTQDVDMIAMAARSESDDRERAKQVAARRRRKQLALNVTVRLDLARHRAGALADLRRQDRSGAVHHAVGHRQSRRWR